MLNIAPIDQNNHGDATNTPQARLLFSAVHQDDVRRIKSLIADRVKRSGHLPATDLLTETVTITPAMAEHILVHHNTHNRGLRSRHVDRFTRIIRAGQWLLTSQGISFARDGSLNDGQHRLHAIVRAGRPVAIRVTFGEAREAFTVLDTNAGRNGSDTLHVAEYKNTSTLAAAARLLAIIESGNPLANITISNDAVLDVVKAHPNLNEATTPGARIGKKFKCSVAATTVAYYLISEHSPRKTRVNEFFDRLADGAGQGTRSPILAVRDGLMKKDLDAHFRSAGNRAVAQSAAIIKAWNAWVSGRKNNLIRWEAGENFPLPV
jgi:hypothetical protein